MSFDTSLFLTIAFTEKKKKNVNSEKVFEKSYKFFRDIINI